MIFKLSPTQTIQKFISTHSSFNSVLKETTHGTTKCIGSSQGETFNLMIHALKLYFENYNHSNTKVSTSPASVKYNPRRKMLVRGKNIQNEEITKNKSEAPKNILSQKSG